MAGKDKELLTSLQDKFKASVEHETWKSFSTNATNDFEFLEGIQWSNDELSALRDRGQPTTVENEIKPIIDRIKGQYKTQKTRIIFKGRNIGKDESHADILSALALHVQQQTGYEFEEGDMFDDGQGCGFGALEAFITFEDDLTPKINLKSENCLNIFPDPNSKNYDWNEDAEYICRAKWVSYEKAKLLYSDYKEEIEGFINSNPISNNSQQMEKNHLIDTRLKRIRLVEVWYKTWKRRKFAVSNLLGGVAEVSKFSKAQIKEIEAQDPNIKYHEKIEPQIRVGIFCGETLLEDKDSPYEHNLFPFVPFFVFRRKNGEPFSTVRMLKDPQMEINKRRSKALHLLNTNQVVYEEGAVRDDDELKREVAKPDGVIKRRKGFELEIVKNVELASSQLNLQMESKNSIARISGVSDEAMARHSEIRSGIGLQRKQMMTSIIMTPIFDNLRRTRLIIGKLIFELIRQYYTEEKIFTIIDDMNQSKEYALNMQQITAFKEREYDIIIEEAPDTTTIQEEQFAYLSELVKGLPIPPNVSMALLPIFIRLSQLKNKEEVIQMLEQLQQAPPEKPKTSLSLQWNELYPEEKAAFAQMMGMDELAQFEMQAQRDPVSITKSKTEIQKAQMNKTDPEIEMAIKMSEMEMKGEEHQQKMTQNKQSHNQKMEHAELSGIQKMMMQEESGKKEGNE